jgi:uncharacterized protein (TIGR02646 family)
VRAIVKGPEPPSLTKYRQTPGNDYDNYPDKETLRYALVAEQHGLCCYCMGRIHNDPTKMKIEHWKCQSRYPDDQVDYHNLLGACRGEEGRPSHLQHCDTRKGNSDLKWNPADPDHGIESKLRYELDGSIRSDDEEFDAQIKDVLNLNMPYLKNNRKGALDAVLHWWKEEKARLHGPVSKERLERERTRRIEGNGKLEPYCQVVVWWLEQRLSRMSA